MRPHTTDGSFGSFVGGFNFADSRGAATPVYRFRGGGSAIISRSVLPAIHPRAPPVGLYNVNRIMDDILPDKNDIFGHCTTASFKTSGRAKPLMGDAIHFATMREEEKFSNMGPGSYEHRDIWSANNRMTVTRVSTAKSVKPVGGVPFADKPWKQPPPLILRKKVKPGSNTPPPQPAKKPGSINLQLDSTVESDAKELQRDIQTVRNLPNYG